MPTSGGCSCDATDCDAMMPMKNPIISCVIFWVFFFFSSFQFSLGEHWTIKCARYSKTKQRKTAKRKWKANTMATRDALWETEQYHGARKKNIQMCCWLEENPYCEAARASHTQNVWCARAFRNRLNDCNCMHTKRQWKLRCWWWQQKKKTKIIKYGFSFVWLFFKNSVTRHLSAFLCAPFGNSISLRTRRTDEITPKNIISLVA